MNPRHTIALVLIAFGTFLILVGAIFGGVGLAKLAESTDPLGTKLSAGFAITGGLVLTGGVLAFLLGIRIYRRSDHRVPVVRDQQGRVVGRRFPILSPVMIVLFLLVTGSLAWSTAEYGMDLTDPEAVDVYIAWGVLAVAFLAALSTAGCRRLRKVGVVPKDGPGPGAEAESSVREVHLGAERVHRGQLESNHP
jgi:hypothetical protein